MRSVPVFTSLQQRGLARAAESSVSRSASASLRSIISFSGVSFSLKRHVRRPPSAETRRRLQLLQKWVRDGVDYADSAPRRFVDEILRRTVGVCAAALFLYPAAAGEHGEDFLPAYEGFLRPHVVLERHEFYEPQQKAVLLRKFKQPLHFSVVEARG